MANSLVSLSDVRAEIFDPVTTKPPGHPHRPTRDPRFGDSLRRAVIAIDRQKRSVRRLLADLPVWTRRVTTRRAREAARLWRHAKRLVELGTARAAVAVTSGAGELGSFVASIRRCPGCRGVHFKRRLAICHGGEHFPVW